MKDCSWEKMASNSVTMVNSLDWRDCSSAKTDYNLGSKDYSWGLMDCSSEKMVSNSVRKASSLATMANSWGSMDCS